MLAPSQLEHHQIGFFLEVNLLCEHLYSPAAGFQMLVTPCSQMVEMIDVFMHPHQTISIKSYAHAIRILCRVYRFERNAFRHSEPLAIEFVHKRPTFLFSFLLRIGCLVNTPASGQFFTAAFAVCKPLLYRSRRGFCRFGGSIFLDDLYHNIIIA